MAEEGTIIGTMLSGLILIGALAYALSGDFQASAAIFSIYWMYPIVALVSFIPLGGVFAQWYIMTFISSVMHIPNSISWMESLIFWALIIVGAIACTASSVILLINIENWLKTIFKTKEE